MIFWFLLGGLFGACVGGFVGGFMVYAGTVRTILWFLNRPDAVADFHSRPPR